MSAPQPRITEASTPVDGTDAVQFDQRKFRDVLGHLPSGVVAVTGLADDGNPVGMVVGTFASVSLEPALVAFFVDQRSTSFPRIREAGVFCANVLSARQEPLCRALAARGGDKFAGVEWRPADSGAPMLDGAVAWVDCDIESITSAGDHLIVIGRVRDLGVSTPTIPLLFFQGGFGGWAPMSLAVEARSELYGTLRCVDRVRAGMEALASELEVDCLAHAAHGGNSVAVAAAYAPRRSRTFTRVGSHLPLVPPWGEPFMTWAPQEELEDWLGRLRADRQGRYDVDDVAAHVSEIRRHGWAFTLRSAAADDDRALEDLVRYGYTPAIERDLVDLISTRGRHGDPAAFDNLPTGSVRNLCAPVLDADGRLVLMLALHNLPTDLPTRHARRYLDRLLDLTEAATPAERA
ncbi:flavin reductase [Nocardioides humi]|uniref:Flavin reductase n=1 Tax=Nocardioides humi TaxID=449461 RepID=A0ABN2ABN9_9ACTN|nr:flavin reductase [Nocardioides humi]